MVALSLSNEEDFMARYMNREMTRQELMKCVGHINQLAGIKSYEMNSGKAHGLKAHDITTGSGLEFTVLEGKCLDIAGMSYKGINLNFLAKPGLVAPYFFNPHGNEFLRNYQAGMLYTCGLSNVGPACQDEGKEYNIHGRINHTPADNVSAIAEWEGDEYILSVSGEMREAALFNENLVLHREIRTGLGAKRLEIHDMVENQGFEEQGLMLLYHFNLGYPLLDEEVRLIVADSEVTPRDAEAAKGTESYNTFHAPMDGYREQVFYHKVAADTDGNTWAGLINERLGLGLYIKYNVKQLPQLIQWKSMMSGDYALGIEPANCLVGGRAAERQRGTLQTLAPFEKVQFDLELGVLEGEQEIQSFVDMVGKLKK
jgi:hypothetical protein